MDWKDYIEMSPEVLHGRPRFKGTRIAVSLILGYLADGYTVEKIIELFSNLTPAHISACLYFARDISDSSLEDLHIPNEETKKALAQVRAGNLSSHPSLDAFKEYLNSL